MRALPHTMERPTGLHAADAVELNAPKTQSDRKTHPQDNAEVIAACNAQPTTNTNGLRHHKREGTETRCRCCALGHEQQANSAAEAESRLACPGPIPGARKPRQSPHYGLLSTTELGGGGPIPPPPATQALPA